MPAFCWIALVRALIAGWRLRLIRPTKPLRPVGRISGTRHPAMRVHVASVESFRSPDVQRNFFLTGAVNGTREAAALPLSIPAAPRGNRCCALRSPPACLTAAGSTRHPVSVRLCPPSMASRPCHSRFGSPISAGTQPLAVRFDVKGKSVLLKECLMAAAPYQAYKKPVSETA